MKKLVDLSLDQVQLELEKRGLTVHGKDKELGQLLTDLSRQRLSDWLEDNGHDPDDFIFKERTLSELKTFEDNKTQQTGEEETGTEDTGNEETGTEETLTEKETAEDSQDTQEETTIPTDEPTREGGRTMDEEPSDERTE